MKTIAMTVVLLIAVASINALAQGGGKTPGRYPTPTAEGVPSSGQSSQSATSGQKKESTMGTGSTRSQTGTEISKSQSNGRSGQASKAGDKRVNQRAAGVPRGGGSIGSTSTKPTKKQ